MTYKLRYGRNFNLGNYESERIELERDIPDDFPEAEAFQLLKKAVEAMRSQNPNTSVPR